MSIEKSIRYLMGAIIVTNGCASANIGCTPRHQRARPVGDHYSRAHDAIKDEIGIVSWAR